MSRDPPAADGLEKVFFDRETIAKWIARCDPQVPIDPDDERYLDFEKFDDDGSLRGEDHITGLYDGVTLKPAPSCQLFSGFSGTGKTTELRRLKKLLEADGYVVLLVDARNYHDLHHALTIEDLAVFVAAAFGDATAELLDEDVVKESYYGRLKDFLKSDISSDVKVPMGVMDLKIGVRNAKPFWVVLRDALAASPEKLREHSHGFIRGCVRRIEAVVRPRPGGVVFVVDSLEKLSGLTPADFPGVMNSLLRVFMDAPDLLRLPSCHVIYSMPPYARIVSPRLAGQFRMSLVLPAIKVFERGEDPAPFAPGVRALSELVARRIPVAKVFGPRRDLLERLVTYSGGHIRMLIVFVQELLYGAARRGLPPAEKDVERAVQPFREQAQMAVRRGGVPILERVLRRGSIASHDDDLDPTVAQFLDDFIVLCYRNGGGWYEVHPLVRDHVRELAAEIAEEGAKKNKSDG